MDDRATTNVWTVVGAVLGILVFVAVLVSVGKGGEGTDTFWSQSGWRVEDQARRAHAAEKGVPDAPWGETYWPPNFCKSTYVARPDSQWCWGACPAGRGYTAREVCRLPCV